MKRRTLCNRLQALEQGQQRIEFLLRTLINSKEIIMGKFDDVLKEIADQEDLVLGVRQALNALVAQRNELQKEHDQAVADSKDDAVIAGIKTRLANVNAQLQIIETVASNTPVATDGAAIDEHLDILAQQKAQEQQAATQSGNGAAPEANAPGASPNASGEDSGTDGSQGSGEGGSGIGTAAAESQS